VTTDQLDLETYVRDQAERARDHGTEAALDSAGLWRDLARGAIAYLAASGHTFTADDVRRLTGEPPSDGALGALFLGAAKRREIVAVGYERSRRPLRRGGVVRVWVGAEAVADRGS